MFQSNPKYIVAANNYLPNGRIFVFHPAIDHRIMYNHIRELGYGEVVSAGFVDEFMQCYGRSMSLSTLSRPNRDTELLKKFFNIQDKDIKYKKEDT